jgi:hypothetical protein
MKKICLLLVSVLIAVNAHAVTCTEQLGLTFTPAQREKLCDLFSAGTIGTIANDTFATGRNAADDANIGVWKVNADDDTQINADASDKIKFSEDDVVGIVFNADDGYIHADTADASDNASICVAGGGTCFSNSRGAYLAVKGNEASVAAGSASLTSGNIAGADTLIAAVDDIIFEDTSGTDSLVIDVATKAATFSGQVTSTGLQFPTANEEAVAGAGTTVADAAALSATKHIHQLTGANGTVGWKFATSVAGQFEFLLNTTAGVPLIYAASGGTCNGGAADAPCTLVTGIVAHICYSTAADTWICA